ncbi:probable receptor-like serine/threonine-protein kinase At5g57670 [Humulus lupulus]|uniref:probable receptor-like serine/threonine-protein kinase At5g57670 n=1 Tax=Humulus lupulus TaxID=3486 RepID=UPI002B40410B|nr:probable receptor-like serine/threonine-protein kinase At5g57670 [Humulus lupulus]
MTLDHDPSFEPLMILISVELNKHGSGEEAAAEKKAPNPNGEEDCVGVVGTESFQRPIWKCFSFEEISEATDGFSSDNLVGKGGYAEVYKGILRNADEIGVKRLTKTASEERKEKDFLTGIGTIGHVHHRNILSLLGCCIDSGLYLIFQFSSIGFVASLLHGENLTPMDWKTRYKIAIGTIFVFLKLKTAKYRSQYLKKKGK